MRLTKLLRRPAAVVPLGVLLVLAVGLGLFMARTSRPERPAPTSGRLGLHTTVEELAIWRRRALEGPYRMRGDVSKNSPGDWERISANKDGFVAQPHAGRWAGPSKNHPGECVINSDASENGDLGFVPPIGEPEQLRDAAFFIMVLEPEDGPGIARAVKGELLWQSTQAGTDFTNTHRFCRDEFGTGYEPTFPISNWLAKLLFAYDYLTIYDPNLFTGAERKQLDRWFRGAAEWMTPIVEVRRENMFTFDPGAGRAVTDEALEVVGNRIWSDGPRIKRVQKRYNNHVPRIARLITMVGIMQGTEEFKDVGRNVVKDTLAFSYYPEGALGDFERWERGNAVQGWKYSMDYVGGMLSIADHLARAGDDSLYRFATIQGDRDTAGRTPHDGITHGQPKSLWTLMRQMARYIDTTSRPVRYGCASCSDLDHRIDSEDELSGERYANDLELLMGNVYYQDPYLKSIYLRERPGTPPYPERPRSGQGRVESGESGIYPGMLLMFGRMEGKINPYPASRPGLDGGL